MNKLQALFKNIFTTKRGTMSVIAIVSTTVVVTAGIGVSVYMINNTKGNNSALENNTQTSGIVYDDKADKGGIKNKTEEEIVEELNKIVDASMINISMNLTPEFENGSAKGTLNVVNDKVNIYPQIVTITRKDTNEEIYKTNAIKVGSSILTDKLDVDLPQGEYKCIASFMAVDEKTGEKLAQANAEITVVIKN